MTRYLTAEEVRTENLKVFGEELGPLFSELSDELTYLHLKWNEFVSLYGTNETRVDVLNAAAGSFFQVLSNILWEDVLLHISRLTDRPAFNEKRGKYNLSLRALPARLQDSALINEVQALLDEAVSAAEFARDWRDRHIAHKDLLLAIGKDVEPLAAASRAHVERALTAFDVVLNRINRAYSGAEMRFDPILNSSGAEELLYVLRDGNEFARKRRDDLLAGRVGPPDWGIPKPL